MQKRHSWVSLILFCTILVAGSALAFAVVIAGASVALASHQTTFAEESHSLEQASNATSDRTFSGMITDSHCGARHMRNTTQNAVECARGCVRKGAMYVLVDGSNRYTLIGGDSAVAQLAGQRATITGTRQGDTLLVDAAAPLF